MFIDLLGLYWCFCLQLSV